MTKGKLKLYRWAAAYLPRPKWLREAQKKQPSDFEALLLRHRTAGAQIVTFEGEKITSSLCYGIASYRDGEAQGVTPDTAFRVASISKHITAMAVLRLYQAGRIDPDADVDAYLPCSLRHPAAPDKPVTLRRLMSHTAGLHDGSAYAAACVKPVPLSELMKGDCFAANPDGFEYSNLGAGIVACVLEGMTGQSFETLMQETVFGPFKVTASFYPQTLSAPLADAFRVMKRSAVPSLDSRRRHERPLPDGKPDPEMHYLLAQGNLYISAQHLARLGIELTRERYAPMRRKVIDFGARDRDLTEGLGTFIVHPGVLCDRAIYGHQGLAYGAMHGLFYDPVSRRGAVLLTAGASEAREGVLSDINKAVMRKVFQNV